MSEPEPTAPLTLIGLSRFVLADLLAPHGTATTAGLDRRRRIIERLDEVADALVLGVDVVPPPTATATAQVGIDATIAAITLAHSTSRVGLIVAAAPQRDHPYNLARRLATLDHATGGRVGLFLGDHDPSATPGSPWTNASGPEAAADAVVVLRELWRSFPVDAIVGDRETGVFSESHRIFAIDHRGAFDVTGPLQVPTSPQIWPPVLAWAGTAAAAGADLAISPDDPRFALSFPADLTELERRLAGQLPAANTASTLRARLGLPPAQPPSGGRPVFPTPPAPTAAEKVGSRGR